MCWVWTVWTKVWISRAHYVLEGLVWDCSNWMRVNIKEWMVNTHHLSLSVGWNVYQNDREHSKYQPSIHMLHHVRSPIFLPNLFVNGLHVVFGNIPFWENWKILKNWATLPRLPWSPQESEAQAAATPAEIAAELLQLEEASGGGTSEALEGCVTSSQLPRMLRCCGACISLGIFFMTGPLPMQLHQPGIWRQGCLVCHPKSHSYSTTGDKDRIFAAHLRCTQFSPKEGPRDWEFWLSMSENRWT